jgi:predicted short-subunit dehydrogenase-like oxidoreductase (DUF2520 family)
MAELDIFIVGAGKVGGALTKALRERGATVVLRAARKGLPRTPIDADLLVLAVRDGQLAALVAELLAQKGVTRKTNVVHCAGALGPEPLEPLRAICAGVAQMHPMISFANPKRVPSLARGQVHVAGDPSAVRVAVRVARLLGMTPRTIPALDRIAYHAAAGLVANGAAALALAGSKLLQKGGVPPDVAPLMLGPLLRSVADNVERLGLPSALTGPVRRGDAAGVRRHLDVIASRTPELVPLYRALVLAQVPMARELGDAEPAAFDAIAAAVRG